MSIFVDSPQDGSQHVNGIVTFEGRAEDDYRNNFGPRPSLHSN